MQRPSRAAHASAEALRRRAQAAAAAAGRRAARGAGGCLAAGLGLLQAGAERGPDDGSRCWALVSVTCPLYMSVCCHCHDQIPTWVLSHACDGRRKFRLGFEGRNAKKCWLGFVGLNFNWLGLSTLELHLLGAAPHILPQ